VLSDFYPQVSSRLIFYANKINLLEKERWEKICILIIIIQWQIWAFIIICVSLPLTCSVLIIVLLYYCASRNSSEAFPAGSWICNRIYSTSSILWVSRGRIVLSNYEISHNSFLSIFTRLLVKSTWRGFCVYVINFMNCSSDFFSALWHSDDSDDDGKQKSWFTHF
jgi:hypothetical protein